MSTLEAVRTHRDLKFSLRPARQPLFSLAPESLKLASTARGNVEPLRNMLEQN